MGLDIVDCDIVGFDVVEVHVLGLGVVDLFGRLDDCRDFVKTYQMLLTYKHVYLCSYLSMKNGMPHDVSILINQYLRLETVGKATRRR